MQEQDASFADLYRERRALKQSLAQIEKAIEPYPKLFAQLSDDIKNDKPAAMGVLRTLDTTKCFELLRQWFSIGSQLSDNRKKIEEMGGEVV